jgi:hypothetical protein
VQIRAQRKTGTSDQHQKNASVEFPLSWDLFLYVFYLLFLGRCLFLLGRCLFLFLDLFGLLFLGLLFLGGGFLFLGLFFGLFLFSLLLGLLFLCGL